MMWPTVSITTPTKVGREGCLERVMRMGERNRVHYPNIQEHIIVQDTEGANVGRMRNACCTVATGEVIVHMDDDDLYADDWVLRSVTALLESGADVVGLGDMIFDNVDTGQMWRYQYPERWQAVSGATMCYRRELWTYKGYRDMVQGEDMRFIADAGASVYHHGYRDGWLGTIHAGNTSPKHTSGRRWSEWTEGHILKTAGH